MEIYPKKGEKKSRHNSKYPVAHISVATKARVMKSVEQSLGMGQGGGEME